MAYGHVKILAALSIGMSLAVVQANAAEVTLRIDSWLSPAHVQNAKVFPEWVKQLEAATNGEVTATISYPPQTHPRTMFDRTRTGVADITWGLHDYTPGRFVVNEVGSLPASGADDAYVQSVAYWRIHEKFLTKFDEHAGVKVLALFTHGPGTMTSRKEIKSYEDLKGMKIRVAGGLSAKIVEGMGMVSVPTPGNKIYEVLSTGIVDAALSAMEGKSAFKLNEVAKYTVQYPGSLFFSSFFTIMNEDKFKSLKPAHQQAIMKVSGENLVKLTGKHWTGSDDFAFNEAKAAGINFLVVDGAFKAKMAEAFKPVEADWFKAAKEKGLADPAAVLTALRAEVAKVKAEPRN